MREVVMRALASTLAFILAVISDPIQRVTGQDFNDGVRRNNSCTLRSSQDQNHCDFCIQSAQCAWCADSNWNGPRCDLRAWWVLLNILKVGIANITKVCCVFFKILWDVYNSSFWFTILKTMKISWLPSLVRHLAISMHEQYFAH